MDFEENTGNESNFIIPPDVEEAANRATLDLLPQKSRQQYDIAYKRLIEWCKMKKVADKFTENILLAYFEEKSKLWKASTLWSNFSMIKASLQIKNNVDISKYYKLIAFLKRKSVGYRPKKSKIFTSEQINTFLNEAPDTKYLMIKVASIFGLFGACRREELCKLTLDDIEKSENSLLIHILETKTNVRRSFCIVGSYMNYYHKYAALRPATVTHRRFFLNYVNDKCTVQPVGINTFGKIPTNIAEFLKLPDPKQFTGHCFRRSSASLLADSGANLITIKRHGGWKSSAVAEGYIEDSITNKNKIAERILPSTSTASNAAIALENPSTLTSASSGDVDDSTAVKLNTSAITSQGINISNCSGCNININVSK